MFRRLALVLAVLLLPGACAPAAPDAPAHYTRMGRFMGLAANCGCAGVPPDRMIAEYRKAAGGRYSETELKAMGGYVRLGAEESWDNMTIVCAEICAQRCMVRAVTEPLGGTDQGVPACPVTERDLHLTDGAPVETGTDN